MEEMLNEVMDTEEINESTEIATVEPDDYGVKDPGNGSAKLLIGAICLAAGAGAALWKNRHKIGDAVDQRRIKKLEKKGFAVKKIEELEEESEEVFVEEESEE